MAHRVLDKSTSGPDVPEIDYRLVLLEDRKPNAFAIPGGVIGVTSGPPEQPDDEIELETHPSPESRIQKLEMYAHGLNVTRE